MHIQMGIVPPPPPLALKVGFSGNFRFSFFGGPWFAHLFISFDRRQDFSLVEVDQV